MAWDQIFGHQHQREQLFAAYQRGRLGHAYVFIGPEGIGKKRFAFEFAKALLCADQPAPFSGCDHCVACIQVMALTHPDFSLSTKPEDRLEFTIDTMREVIHDVALRPIRGSRKITIIDDADDFNEESANCFLKTCEEPPDGAILILLATSADRLLSTIVSRCQVVYFKPLKDSDLTMVLQRDAEVEPIALARILRISRGSASRALALLDPEIWSLRTALHAIVTARKPDSVTLARKMIECTEAAGKESTLQRQRASLLVLLSSDLFRAALRQQFQTHDDNCEDRQTIVDLARRNSESQLISVLESCVESDRLIERRVQLALVLEQLADRLCQS